LGTGPWWERLVSLFSIYLLLKFRGSLILLTIATVAPGFTGTGVELAPPGWKPNGA